MCLVDGKSTIRDVVNTVQSRYLNPSLMPQTSGIYVYIKMFSSNSSRIKSNSVMLDTAFNLYFTINWKYELYIKAHESKFYNPAKTCRIPVKFLMYLNAALSP